LPFGFALDLGPFPDCAQASPKHSVMPWKRKQPCSFPGCGKLCASSRCEEQWIRKITCLSRSSGSPFSRKNSFPSASDRRCYVIYLSQPFLEARIQLRRLFYRIALSERQKILRLLAKEVLVGKDSITIRHSIPISRSGPDSGTPPAPDPPKPKIAPSYLLRSGSNGPALRHTAT
jgi:hypothetical protein